MKQQPQAFIFDLDGVITDTAEEHFLAWKQLASELGIIVDRAFNEQLKGVGRMESLEKILRLKPSLPPMSVEEKENLASKKNSHYKALIAKTTPENILPGIKLLLEHIHAAGIKVALGSASKNARTIVEHLEIGSYFDYIVDAAQITNGKPHPETFMNAADAFGFSHENCIGVEDAIAGIEAINSANMFSVGVGSADHLHAADYVVEDTSLLQFGEILDHYAAWKRVKA